MAIMFPPGLREFIEIYVGANVATGNEDKGAASRNPYDRLADDLESLSEAMKGAIAGVGKSLPPQIAAEFIAAMKLFVDDNGQNHLHKLADEVRKTGRRQVDRSIKLSEAKYQILIEFIIMNIELALIAALSVFTGGTSLTEIAVQKSRTALTILLLLQRMGHAVPTPLSVLLEAIQEAFVAFAAQLISMTVPDDPDRRRKQFDWGDIAQSAVAGAFAGFFGGIFGQFGGSIINRIFKNNKFWKEASELPFSFINEGQAETFAEAFTSLIFLGTFALNPGTFLSAGLSGLIFEAASTGAEFGGKFLYAKFFQNLDLGPDGLNNLPGGGNRYGNTYDTTGPQGDFHHVAYTNGAPNPYDVPDSPYTAPYTSSVNGSGTYDSDADNSSVHSDSSSIYGGSSSDYSDTASVFSDTSDTSTFSSFTDYDTDDGVQPGAVNGNNGAQSGPGALGAGKPSYNSTPSDAYTHDYGDPTTDDVDTTVPGAGLGRNTPPISSNHDPDSVFSTLNPPVTTDPGADGTVDTGEDLGNIPSTAGSSAPGLSAPGAQAGGGGPAQEESGRQRSADGGTTTPITDGTVDTGEDLGNIPSTAGSSAPGLSAPGIQAGGGGPAQEESGRQRSADGGTTTPITDGTLDSGDGLGNFPSSAGSSAPGLSAPAARAEGGGPAPDGTADVGTNPLVPPVAPIVGASPTPTPTPSTSATPAPAVSPATPQQRPQTTTPGRSGPDALPGDTAPAVTDDPAGTAGPPTSAVDTDSADHTRTPSSEEARTTPEVPPPYRPVRTESEEIPAVTGPAEPVPVVSREMPPAAPGVGETLGSPSPAESREDGDGDGRLVTYSGRGDSASVLDDDSEDDSDSDSDSDSDDAYWEEFEARQNLLTEINGSGIVDGLSPADLLAALGRLDDLRRGAQALGDRRFDRALLDDVARAVLLLDTGDPVTDGQLAELIGLVAHPTSEGASVRNLAALAAVRLRDQGVFSPAYEVRGPDGLLRGWDWTRSPVGELELSRYSRRNGTATGDTTSTSPWAPPGSPEPIVLRADGDHKSVEVPGPGDTRQVVPESVLVELMTRAPGLNQRDKDIPLLLVVPGAGARGLELPRRLAHRLDRGVWAATGPVGTSRQSDPSLPPVVTGHDVEGKPPTEWVFSPPGMVLDPEVYGHPRASERTMTSHTLVAADGKSSGRSVYKDDEAAAMVAVDRHAEEATELWHYDVTTDQMTKDDNGLPFAGLPVYRFFAHGLPGRVYLPTEENQRRYVDGPTFGGMLRRRPSLAGLSKEYAVVTTVCFANTPQSLRNVRRGVQEAFVPDPLGVDSPAEHAATETGRTVFGANRKIGLTKKDGKWVYVLFTDAWGRRGAWVENRPKPTTERLSELARRTGLHQGPGHPSPETLERTMRLVRALRQNFTVKIEDGSEYDDLFTGIAALERMRHADPLLRASGPFTQDLFTRLALDYRQQQRNVTQGELTPADYRDLLRAVAGEVRQNPDFAERELSAAFALPAVTDAAQYLNRIPDLGAEIARVLGSNAPAATVGDFERTRYFWATVKALEWQNAHAPFLEDRARYILHTDQLGPHWHSELFSLATKAAARGVELSSPYSVFELGIFHLKSLGALSEPTLLSDGKGKPTGRNWAGNPSGTKVDVNRARAVDPTSVSGVGPETDMPWVVAKEYPRYLAWFAEKSDRLRMELPGGVSLWVSYEEAAELLAMDEAMAEDAQVVLAASSHASPVQPSGAGSVGGTPDRDPRPVIAQVSNRITWGSPGAVGLLQPSDPSLPHILSLLPLPDGRPQAVDDWTALGTPRAPGMITYGPSPRPLEPIPEPEPTSEPEPEPTPEPEPQPAQFPKSMLLPLDDQDPDPDPGSNRKADPAPWYFDEGALGQVVVAEETKNTFFSPSRAESLARKISSRLELPGPPDTHAALREGIKDAVRDLLLTVDPKKWTDLLAVGRTLVVDGRLVWLRPVPSGLTKIETPKGEVSKYPVGFGSTATGGQSGRETSRGLDSSFFTFFNLAAQAAASAFMLTLPQFKLGSGKSKSQNWGRTVLAGRKPFINDFTRYRAGLKIGVFVDGEDATPTPDHLVTVRNRVLIDVPTVYSGEDGHRPDPRAPEAPPPSAARTSKPSQARELLQAVNLTPVIAALHRTMRAAGLPAPVVRDILAKAHMDRSQGFLSESTARNRYPWWVGGDSSDGIELSGALVSKFRGHLRIRREIVSLQYLGDTAVGSRDDIGAGDTLVGDSTGSTEAGLGIGANTTGVGRDPHNKETDIKSKVDGDSPDAEVTALVPTFNASLGLDRSAGHSLATSHLSHTVLNDFAQQSRYRADMRIELVMESSTHRIPPVSVTTVGEVSVPKREAEHFVRRTVGQEWTSDLRPVSGSPDAPRHRVPALPPPRTVLLRPTRQRPNFRFRMAVDRVRQLVAPHPREPLALASRKGLGFGVPVALPGSENLQQELRRAIEQHHIEAVGADKARKSDWSVADRDLAAFYGRPALEADFPQALLGVYRTIEVGGRGYKVAAKAVWGSRLDGDNPMADPSVMNTTDGGDFAMKANTRAVASAKTSGRRGRGWKTRIAGGAAARLSIPALGITIGGRHFGTPPVRFQLASLRGVWRKSGDKSDKLSGAVGSYRRTETGKKVDEHRYLMGLRWQVVPDTKEPKYLSGKVHSVARVVVPEEHSAKRPVTLEQIRTLRTTGVRESSGRPADTPALDFTGGAQGVYPAFHLMPELARLGARMYAEQKFSGERNRARRERQIDAWLDNPADWPEDIRNLAHPAVLAAHFGESVRKGGYETELPKVGNYKQALRLKIHTHNPTDLGASSDVEVEQYAKAATEHEKDRSTAQGLGAESSGGPLFLLGSDGSDAEHPTGPGGRAGLTGRAAVTRTWGNGNADTSGRTDITRATYGGPVHTLRTDPVFELTIVRWRGDELTETTRYLTATEALDLLVPERRMTDLLPPAADSTKTESTKAKNTKPDVTTEQSPDPVTEGKPEPQPEARSAVEPEPTPTRTYLDTGLISGTSHPELMRADEVLDTINARLRAKGIVPTEKDPAVAPRPNLLQRSLKAAYSSDALQTGWHTLTTDGVFHWFPVPGPWATTRYLWVKVTVARMEAPTGQQHREGVKLTLRGQAVTEEESSRKSGLEFSGGVEFRGRAGNEKGHGGIEALAEYTDSKQTVESDTTKTVEIHRVNTQDSSEEFNHDLKFRVELGTSTELPAVLTVPSRTRDGIERIYTGATSLDHEHHVFAWHDPGDQEDQLVDGSVRLIVPQHLTHETDQPQQWPLDLAAPRETEVRWRPRPGADPEKPSVPQASTAPALPKAFLDGLHPWSVPAATAIERWGKLTAVRQRTDPDPQVGSPPVVAGLDPTTSVAGVRYAHYAAAAMMRPRVKELLEHKYKLPMGDWDGLVGLRVDSADILGPPDGTLVKQRRYRQTDEEPEHKVERGKGLRFAFGPEGGGHTDDRAFLETLPADILQWMDSEGRSSSTADTDERNAEGKRKYRIYRFGVTAIVDGPFGSVRIRVPAGLFGMLPVNKATGQLDGDLEDDPVLGHLLRPVTTAESETPPPDEATRDAEPLGTVVSETEPEPVPGVMTPKDPVREDDPAEPALTVPVPKAEPRPLPKAEPGRVPEAEARPVPKADPKAVPKADPEVESGPGLGPVAVTQPVPKAPGLRPEADARPVPKADPEVVSGPGLGPVAVTQPVPKAPGLRPEADARPVPKADPEVVAEPDRGPVATTQPVPKAGPRAQPDLQPEPEPEPEPDADIEAPSDPEAGSREDRGNATDTAVTATDTETPRARGSRIRMPATGECLLYSVVAGDPVHVRGRLTTLAGIDRTAYEWLGNPDAVRDALRRRAELGAQGGTLPADPSRAVLDAMLSFVADYLVRSEGRLHPQILGQFRQTAAAEFGRRVQAMTEDERRDRLDRLGVRYVPVPEALDPVDLRNRYVDARAAELELSEADAREVVSAEADGLGPRRMFQYLQERRLLPTPADLDNDALGRLLAAVYPQSTAPLDDTELTQLQTAVATWQWSWASPVGEVFLPLLAHAFGLRIDVARSFESGPRLVSTAGPEHATRRTEVYYNGADHYDGSDAEPGDRPDVTVRADQVRTAAPAPPAEPPYARSVPIAALASRDVPGPLKGAHRPAPPFGDETAELDVARRVGAVLHALGHPVVLAGAARARVQFGLPRPLGAMEFQLPAATLPAVAGMREALEREMPGASVRIRPVTGGGRVLELSVNGVDITVTAVDRPSPGTVTVDGFTVPAPADSLADAALALVTGTDPELRGRDLLDLLWALHRAPADTPRTVTSALEREDAHRSTQPAGTPSLVVRLSELLDSAALDAEALARHERTWLALGATDADLPALRAELTALADELRARPEVTADPVRALAARLPGLSTADRDATLASLPPADRERLATDPVLVDTLRRERTPAEFAAVAARLMTQVPEGVEQPVSAGDRARTQVARLLRDPDVTARLLKGGSRVVVVPRREAMTSLDAFRHLRGAVTDDGRPWETVRGVGLRSTAVTEENLLGERTTIPGGESAQADGYSTTVHEVAHLVHLHGLDPSDQQRVTEAYRATEQAGEAGSWPDGDLYGYDADGRRSAPNYSSRDEREFFAQLTNVYFMANGGPDPYTGLPRNNDGPEWVRAHHPDLHRLLRRLFGEGPEPRRRHPRSVEPARPRGVRPADVNPVEATDVENEALARARALWDIAEGGRGEDGDAYVAVRALWDGTLAAHAPRPHTPAPLPLPTPAPTPAPVPAARSAAAPPSGDSAVQQRIQELWAIVDATFGSQPLPEQLRNGLFHALRVIESARAGHPRFGAGLDLAGITRMLLHLEPDAPVDAALHYEAFTLAGSAHRRGRGGSLDAIAAYGLTRQGHPEHSELNGDDGAPYGRNWTGRSGVRLRMDMVFDRRGIHSAPWGPTAYTVVAERSAEGAVLVGGRPVSDEEFAELVLHDPGRRPDVPVVVLIEENDGRNETLARVIADRTRTRVWFTYGDLRLEAAPDGRRVPGLVPSDSGSGLEGAWIPADPGLLPDDPAATIRGTNGTVFPDADIESYPLVTVDGQALTGRAFLNAHDMALREEALRVVSAIQHYNNEMEGLPGVYAARQGGLLPLRRGLANSYVYVGHGDSGRTTVPRRSTRANQAVHPQQLGRTLARRRSLRALPPDWPVWLLICEMSMMRADQDLLSHPSSAQYVANETRRTVITVDRQISPSAAEGALPPRLVLTDDPDNPVGRIEEFLPEPRTAALDALADLGGLPAELPDRADRARRWVRALRQTHGLHIDSDPDREAEFHELIEGFGALERLRFQAAGNPGPGLLTWAGLRHIVGRYATRQGWNPSLTAGSLAHLLHAARTGRLHPTEAAAPAAPAAPPVS
ncbi:lonely Cys domain-containing protein, partial [Streptomyces sp. NPDC086080]|uniref:lonely Cys domain-containing protein n=1 Tax=Streptomyces sp. NPDC086080 TaxID=3365748 RepID=UPI0037CE5622